MKRSFFVAIMFFFALCLFAGTEVMAADYGAYLGEENKLFDIADTYPEYPEGWTLPGDKSLDNGEYHFLGFNGEVVMGEGYGYGSDWIAIEFKMATNSGGDNVFRDIDGKNIIGYCYASGGDGFWVGHGDRSYGGTVADQWPTNRFSHYLKTEIGAGSDKDKTGHRTYEQYDHCVILMKNETGTVDSYEGDYYTVATYINEQHLSTEYYKGNFNGMGGIASGGKQYFASLKIYGEEDPYRKLLSSNRLAMDTKFYKGEETVISAVAGDEVTAETTVINCSPYDRTLEYYVAFENGTAKKVDTKEVKAKEEVLLTGSFKAEEHSYYQVLVKDVTNDNRIQTADAGYLPIGDTVTNEMIYGTYLVGEQKVVVSANEAVEAPEVTLEGKIYTVVKEGDTLKLMDGTDVYAVKDNAAADLAYLITDVDAEDMVLEKSTGSNPVVNVDENGNWRYTGDPAAVVVGDTVYLITGHDVSSSGSYNIPEWLCFSTKDLKEWKYEGVILKAADVPWTGNPNGAWASQMIPYGDKYYFYFCMKDRNLSDGQESIGVAVADRPQGPYTSTDAPIVSGHTSDTVDGVWRRMGGDIDPTAWIEVDEEGVEHRYLMWGNNALYMCELNEDMISVKDLDEDGVITTTNDVTDGSGDIQLMLIDGAPLGDLGGNMVNRFEEAPWLYRRQDEDGNYYGQYYLFSAIGLPEKMGYSTADNIWGPWTYQGDLFERDIACNTHHPSVIDFQGKTYMIYHNAMLPGGVGGRRSISIKEMTFNEDGSIDLMEDLSTGLGGVASTIQTRDGVYLGHDIPHENTSQSFEIFGSEEERGNDTKWEIRQGYYVPSGEDEEYYVTIQLLNRPGMYITSNGKVVHDYGGDLEKNMTFKTVQALDGEEGVSFESVAVPGKYLTMKDGVLTVEKPYILSNCSFVVTNDENDIVELPYKDVKKEDWFYESVEYTYIEKIMTGMDETHFGPYGLLSRAQFALILYRMEGSPDVQTDKTFGDVSGNEWYGQAVLWAAEAGVVGGYTNGNFGPTDNITREQMALMMFRYANYLKQDTSNSKDYSEMKDAANVSVFAEEALKWAYGSGIITGKEDGTMIDPQGNTARCEAAAIIGRFMK